MMNFIDVYGNANVTADWLAMDDFVDYVYDNEKMTISERIRNFLHI